MSQYRCADCRNGKHLYAWGTAAVHGPLGADGDIDYIDYDDVHTVHEDSIQCGRHPGAVIERLIGDQWCRWRNCPWCSGEERCLDELAFADAQTGRMTHHGWWPSSRPVGPSPPEQRGHVLYLARGRLLCCQRCDLPISSIRGQEPCRGVSYRAPGSAGGEGE